LLLGLGGLYAASYALKQQPFVRFQTRPDPILFPYTCPSSRTARRPSLLLYEDKAQTAAKKIEAMQLPAYIATRSFGAAKFYAVFCGPIDAKRANAVTERLETKGLSNVHQTSNPMSGSKQKE
jgi:hypothetical protein